MPTLNYRPYPSVDPALSQQPYQRAEGAGPEAFGGLQGAALTGFGEQVERSSTMLANQALAKQEFLNLTETDKLTTLLDDAAHKERYGDPTAGVDENGRPLVPGFKNRFGSDAIDYIKSGEPSKRFTATIDQIAATAPNERVREAFMRQSRAKRSAFDTSLDDHFTSQLQQHNELVQKGRAASADRDASAAWNDDTLFADALKRGRDAVAASLAGETNQDVINAKMAESDSARIGMAIEAALLNDKPERAKELILRYSSGPNPVMNAKLAEHYNAPVQAKLDAQAARRATATVHEGARAAAASYAEDSRIVAEVDKAVQAALDAQPDKNPAVQADLRHQVRTKLGGSAIERAIADDNPNRASRLLQQYSDSMDGEQVKKYHREIQPLLDKQVAAAAAGRVSGAPLVPHTPSSDILGGTGWNASQYETFRSHVAERESGSYAQPPNAGGYMGRYQMGRKEIQETAGRLGVAVPSQQQFLGDPKLQERFFENYTLDHHNSLMAQSDTYRNASPAERAGILMGAHLGGVGGVQRYLNSNGADDPADSNGTRVSSYVRSMRQRFAVGGSLPPAPAPAAAAPATPAPVPPAATPAAPAATEPAAPAASAPAAARPRSAGEAPPGTIEVWGDSLGVGLKSQLKTEGTAVGGAQPAAILANIKAKPGSYWNGKTVILSSGSNGNQMKQVEETIDHLQSRNADVVLVGYGPKFPEKNAKLRELAKTYNARVIDAEDVAAGEGVHPSPGGYASMAGKIRALRSAPIRVPGMKVPGNIPPPPG